MKTYKQNYEIFVNKLEKNIEKFNGNTGDEICCFQQEGFSSEDVEKMLRKYKRAKGKYSNFRTSTECFGAGVFKA